MSTPRVLRNHGATMSDVNHAIQNGLRSRLESLGARIPDHFNVVVVDEERGSVDSLVSVFFRSRHFCIPLTEFEVLLHDCPTINELSIAIEGRYDSVPP